MLEIIMPLGPPSSNGARKSPRLSTKAKVAPARTPGMERERITEQQGKDCHPRGNPHGAKQGLQIHVDAKELTVVVERPRANDHLGRRHRPEAVTEQQGIRQQEKQSDPE